MSEMMTPQGIDQAVERPSLRDCLTELQIELERKRTMLPQKVGQGRMTPTEAARVLAAFETVVDLVTKLEAVAELSVYDRLLEPISGQWPVAWISRDDVAVSGYREAEISDGDMKLIADTVHQMVADDQVPVMEALKQTLKNLDMPERPQCAGCKGYTDELTNEHLDGCECPESPTLEEAWVQGNTK